MKYIVSILFLIPFLASIAQQEKHASDALSPRNNLKGNVSVVTTVRALIKDSIAKSKGDYMAREKSKFDRKGMISSERSYWSDGSPFEISDGVYDKDGNRIQLIAISTKRVTVGVEPPEDNSGFPPKHKWKRIQRRVTEYTIEGKWKASTTFYDDDSVCSRSIEVLDSNGKLKETDLADADNHVYYKSVYSVDSLNQNVITIYRKVHETFYKSRIFIKDTSNREICSYAFHPDGALSSSEYYKYDSLGNEIEYKFAYVNGKYSYYTKTEYLKFDDRGNWTKAIERRDSVQQYQVKRRIKYY